MPEDVDKSLLDRLQALRGSSEPPERIAPEISIDLIERAKTPTREDALAKRLKSLREGASPSPATVPLKADDTSPAPEPTASSSLEKGTVKRSVDPKQSYESEDAAYQTDDKTLEELLGDVGPEESFTTEPDDDDKVKALLEELSSTIPQDDASNIKQADGDEKDADSDDSDGEEMTREADAVIARFRDEMEVEASRDKASESDQSARESDGEEQDGSAPDEPPGDLALPSVPSDLDDQASPSATSPSADMDSITARLAALRATSPDSSASLALPSVPSSRPAGKPIKRLTTRTGYTDDDVDSWCTVCLEDATLRCMGCDGDPYCARCWREMHVGPAAGFDERSHRAVQFTKDRKKKEKKVALGA